MWKGPEATGSVRLAASIPSMGPQQTWRGRRELCQGPLWSGREGVDQIVFAGLAL